LHEVEDPGVFPLVFAEGFVVHEYIHQFRCGCKVPDPACVLFSCQRKA
jgi:hypothetical protein